MKDYVAFVRGALLVDDDAIYEQADADVAEPTPAAASTKRIRVVSKPGKPNRRRRFMPCS